MLLGLWLKETTPGLIRNALHVCSKLRRFFMWMSAKWSALAAIHPWWSWFYVAFACDALATFSEGTFEGPAKWLEDGIEGISVNGFKQGLSHVKGPQSSCQAPGKYTLLHSEREWGPTWLICPNSWKRNHVNRIVPKCPATICSLPIKTSLSFLRQDTFNFWGFVQLRSFKYLTLRFSFPSAHSFEEVLTMPHHTMTFKPQLNVHRNASKDQKVARAHYCKYRRG